MPSATASPHADATACVPDGDGNGTPARESRAEGRTVVGPAGDGEDAAS
ncbi:hypothetical protein J7W19_00595 [Streptomyces mobaraensis NBRC 13819 = DSM 40847]|nr:hypothetical protein [Streptomyces mobaraensis]QTT72129.1 hypothetical protein J7W19_00595 [Streptomyces mobaraensis NBRC 13819 = DSM 40847]